jgi:hypothetical protein
MFLLSMSVHCTTSALRRTYFTTRLQPIYNGNAAPDLQTMADYLVALKEDAILRCIHNLHSKLDETLVCKLPLLRKGLFTRTVNFVSRRRCDKRQKIGLILFFVVLHCDTTQNHCSCKQTFYLGIRVSADQITKYRL